ncbi:uncharacterized protein LOC143294325 isoform X1 [Babylonia areolata]|uniref:uncharacterized protein LOC143294325 isoform X1 n=1 Tax=Babylonia areolata TaxID=304850 RepID=UPI003FD14149
MFSDGAIPRKMVKGETHKHKPGNNSNSNRFRFVPPFTTTSAESSDTGRCSLQRRQRDDDGDRSKQGPAGCGTGGDYGEEFIFRGAEDEGPPPGDSVKGSVGDGPLSAACLPVQSGVHGIAGRVGKEKGGRGGGKNARSGRRRKSTSFRGQFYFGTWNKRGARGQTTFIPPPPTPPTSTSTTTTTTTSILSAAADDGDATNMTSALTATVTSNAVTSSTAPPSPSAPPPVPGDPHRCRAPTARSQSTTRRLQTGMETRLASSIDC